MFSAKNFSRPTSAISGRTKPTQSACVRILTSSLSTTIFRRVLSGSVLQVNTSKGGVPKLPVMEALATPLGFEGDLHAHPEVHGGPQKALLWITSEGIDELKAAGFP